MWARWNLLRMRVSDLESEGSVSNLQKRDPRDLLNPGSAAEIEIFRDYGIHAENKNRRGAS